MIVTSASCARLQRPHRREDDHVVGDVRIEVDQDILRQEIGLGATHARQAANLCLNTTLFQTQPIWQTDTHTAWDRMNELWFCYQR